MNRGQPRQLEIHVSERERSIAEASDDPRRRNIVLAVLAVCCLAVGVPGLVSAWPRAVDALRQTGRLQKSHAILVDLRVVEIPDPRRDDATLWRKEGLFEFTTNGVDRQEWVAMGDFQKRSEVIPGGYGERHVLWIDPETESVTRYPPNEFHRWFLLMFYVVLCLGGFSSGLVLAQRLLIAWKSARGAPRVES